MQPGKSEFDILFSQIRRSLTDIATPMNVRGDFNFVSTLDPAVVELQIWNPHLTLTTTRRQFREIADMSDAERERWLTPYVVQLAEASKVSQQRPPFAELGGLSTISRRPQHIIAI